MFYTKEQVDVKVQECKQETRAAFAEMEQQLTETEASLKAVIDENHNTSQRVRFAARTFVCQCCSSHLRVCTHGGVVNGRCITSLPHLQSHMQRVVPKLASLTRLARSFPVYCLRTRFTHLLHSLALRFPHPPLLCTSPTIPALPPLRFAPPAAPRLPARTMSTRMAASRWWRCTGRRISGTTREGCARRWVR